MEAKVTFYKHEDKFFMHIESPSGNDLVKEIDEDDFEDFTENEDFELREQAPPHTD